jgi:hypothetical protein
MPVPPSAPVPAGVKEENVEAKFPMLLAVVVLGASGSSKACSALVGASVIALFLVVAGTVTGRSTSQESLLFSLVDLCKLFLEPSNVGVDGSGLLSIPISLNGSVGVFGKIRLSKLAVSSSSCKLSTFTT